MQAEQSNSSILYGDRLILKLFRRVETGLNPDLELSSYLTQHGYTATPPLAGAIEYRRSGQEPWALGMLQQFVPNRSDAWQYTLERLAEFLRIGDRQSAWASRGVTVCGRKPVREHSARVTASRGKFLRRHSSLTPSGWASVPHNCTPCWPKGPGPICAEPFTAADADGFSQRALNLSDDTFRLLHERLVHLPPEVATDAAIVLALEPACREQLSGPSAEPVSVAKIRCHGDFHLGQILVTDDDFVIIDFEGEPARPLAERRRSNSRCVTWPA